MIDTFKQSVNPCLMESVNELGLLLYAFGTHLFVFEKETLYKILTGDLDAESFSIEQHCKVTKKFDDVIKYIKVTNSKEQVIVVSGQVLSFHDLSGIQG